METDQRFTSSSRLTPSRKFRLVEELRRSIASQIAVEPTDELKRFLLVLEFLPLRDFGPDDWIAPSSLVELETNGKRTLCFVVPASVAWFTDWEGQPVQVIGARSVLGEALLGKKTGETLEIEGSSGRKIYTVLSHE